MLDAVVAESVGLTYGNGALAAVALEDVCLRFERGVLNLIMGPSGSGKTSLLSILGCLLRPSRGAVRLLGSEVSGLSEDERAAFRARNIGYVFQAFRLFRALSALENVMLPLELAGAGAEAAAEEARRRLGALGLAQKQNLKPAELSGGEKQRVALARALVTRPAILLADEPTASLDSATGLEVAALLRDCASSNERVVVVVSHDTRLLPFAQRTILLKDGRVVDDRR